MRKVGLPQPAVEETEGGVRVSIKRRSMEEIIAAGDGEFHDGSKSGSSNGSKSGSSNGSKSGSSNSCNKGSERRSIIATKTVTQRQEAIIDMIKGNPYVTAKEMATTLSAGVRTVYRDLSFLQKRNIIRHEGSTYAGIWVILEQSNIK